MHTRTRAHMHVHMHMRAHTHHKAEFTDIKGSHSLLLPSVFWISNNLRRVPDRIQQTETVKLKSVARPRAEASEEKKESLLFFSWKVPRERERERKKKSFFLRHLNQTERQWTTRQCKASDVRTDLADCKGPHVTHLPLPSPSEKWPLLLGPHCILQILLK